MTDGRDLKAGDKAPDFELMTDAGSPCGCQSFAGTR